jgi:hypothetical protein
VIFPRDGNQGRGDPLPPHPPPPHGIHRVQDSADRGQAGSRRACTRQYEVAEDWGPGGGGGGGWSGERGGSGELFIHREICTSTERYSNYVQSTKIYVIYVE